MTYIHGLYTSNKRKLIEKTLISVEVKSSSTFTNKSIG